MKDSFYIREGLIVRSTRQEGNILVYDPPTEEEKQELLKSLHLDQHALESAIDPDEISRVEFTPECLFIIWKRPNNVSFKQLLKFEVSSIGFLLKQDRLTIILGEITIPFESKEFHGIKSTMDVVLKFMLHTTHHFLSHLKIIRQLAGELQIKLNASMENRYLLQMFNLVESLIYYLNALEANASALTKLRANVDKIGLSTEQVEVLDDIIIEHQQCCKQAQIYSSVLSGLMDARGTIINNNVNVLLRNLTLINVVFLPLNLIASVGGMSEYTMMTEGTVNWKVAYSLFLLGMLVLGVLTWVTLVMQISRNKLNGITK